MNNTDSPVIMSQNVFLLFDALSFIAAIASLILAVIAIWLALSFKKDTDNVNKQTGELLTEIKAESKYISQGVMSELKAYGDSMRGAFNQNTSTDNSTFSGTPTNFSMSNNTDSDDAKEKPGGS